MSTRARKTVNTGGIGAALAVAVAVAAVLGLVSGPRSALAGGESLSVRSHGDGDDAEEHIKWSSGRRGIEIWTRGEVHFRDDFTDVTRLDPGGRFKLRERDGFVYRSVTIEPGDDGTLAYSHHVSGFPSAWDADARSWFMTLLPEAVEKTGVGAETLARNLLATSGVDGVLAGIDDLTADRIRLIYYRVLLDDALPAALARVARHAGREIESDHYRHEVLTAILDENRSGPGVQDAVAGATLTFESDHYRAGVLDTLAGSGYAGEAFFESIAGMSSDHYRAGVLGRLAPLQPTEAVCGAIESIQSDYYRTEVLLAMSPLPATRPVLDLVAAIDSDHYRHMVLSTLVESLANTPEAWDGVLDVTRSFDSDHYKADVLTGIAPRMTVDESTVDAFLLTTSTLSSDHYTNEVLEEILRRDDLDDAALRKILTLVRSDIEGAHARGRLVEQIASRIID